MPAEPNRSYMALCGLKAATRSTAWSITATRKSSIVLIVAEEPAFVAAAECGRYHGEVRVQSKAKAMAEVSGPLDHRVTETETVHISSARGSEFHWVSSLHIVTLPVSARNRCGD
jgi:hypothetical protein